MRGLVAKRVGGRAQVPAGSRGRTARTRAEVILVVVCSDRKHVVEGEMFGAPFIGGWPDKGLPILAARGAFRRSRRFALRWRSKRRADRPAEPGHGGGIEEGGLTAHCCPGKLRGYL